MQKICSKCKESKDAINDFWRVKKGSEARLSVCKECCRKENTDRLREYRRLNPKKYNEKASRWNKNNREKYLGIQNRSNAKRKEYHKNWYTLNAHGLTFEDKIKIIEEQEYRCLICGRDLRKISERHIHIDHNHNSGVIRGVLCYWCNVGIGHLQESVSVLEKAILYLITRENKTVNLNHNEGKT